MSIMILMTAKYLQCNFDEKRGNMPKMPLEYCDFDGNGPKQTQHCIKSVKIYPKNIVRVVDFDEKREIIPKKLQ